MELIFNIAPYNWMGIFTSLLCGTIIGLERQFRGKPVGIRTSSLIVVGTYIFVATANFVVIDSSTYDPSRIIGQVITGVGFLGAGVMLAKDGAVVGVTSAATIWVLAAIGVSIANNNYSTSIILSFVVVFILVGVDILENTFQALSKGVHTKYTNWKQQPTPFRLRKVFNPKNKEKQ
ncbi:MgtC/SapB family protein [uncultured Psychrosphaera sp.]|jgi:putative Mg2+ transporter-C (MgtC) family protein|uniref:MgtC/SapB family protein n=1 Tax=uncultured Psychrosphaera sp. TaxID=1403522 RepID=UPI00261ECA10|nr:MgtC/SapB family protein [uncultured Psychrosphaera sp.]